MFRYHTPLPKRKKLSFGIEAGILNSDIYEIIADDVVAGILMGSGARTVAYQGDRSDIYIKGVVNYSVQQNIDIEASYVVVSGAEATYSLASGSTSGTASSTIDISSFDIYGLYYVNTSLFLKGGVYSVTAELNGVASDGSSLSVSDSTTGLLLGAGTKRGHWRYILTFYRDGSDSSTFSVGYLF